jgi:thiopeptide-type bacteriocin biosynthesis protein
MASDTADSVLAVLAGVPLEQAAARNRIQPADLADAMETYRAAGYAALQAQAAKRDWYQVRIQFTTWDTAEHIAATRLGPHLAQMHVQQVTAAWWFIRKAPCWRLRLQRGPAAGAGIKAALGPVLDQLIAAGLIQRWWETTYEPESAAFGGPAGMDTAHELFHADSHHILGHVVRPVPAPGELPTGRRELSILLCGALLRAAGLDWYEQGDVWHRVTLLRPLPPAIPAARVSHMTDSLRRLLTCDTGLDGPLFGARAPVAFAAPWAAAFGTAGRALGDAATAGILERGVRDILAHHVIFHWNRLGLTDTTQAILTRAARDCILGPPDNLPGVRAAGNR